MLAQAVGHSLQLHPCCNPSVPPSCCSVAGVALRSTFSNVYKRNSMHLGQTYTHRLPLPATVLAQVHMQSATDAGMYLGPVERLMLCLHSICMHCTLQTDNMSTNPCYGGQHNTPAYIACFLPGRLQGQLVP